MPHRPVDCRSLDQLSQDISKVNSKLEGLDQLELQLAQELELVRISIKTMTWDFQEHYNRQEEEELEL